MKRVILLTASLALAAAMLIPASALGKVGGTNLPVKGKASGTATLNTTTGVAVIALTGEATHLGKLSESTQAFIFPGCAPAQLCYLSHFTQTAASGAQVTGDCTGSGTTADGVHTTFAVHCLITGGTDRFKDASGSFDVTAQNTLVATNGDSVTFDVVARARGTVSLNKKP